MTIVAAHSYRRLIGIEPMPIRQAMPHHPINFVALLYSRLNLIFTAHCQGEYIFFHIPDF